MSKVDVTLELKWYHFSQNNSGGSFYGPTDIWVQARNAEEANYRSKEVGIYFNGVAEERDCRCCGDRWYTASEYSATDAPEMYGVPVKDYISTSSYRNEGLLYHYDGTEETAEFKKADETCPYKISRKTYFNLRDRAREASESIARAKKLKPFIKKEADEIIRLANLDLIELNEHLKNVKVSICERCSGSGKVWKFFKCSNCEGDGHTYYMINCFKWVPNKK